MPLPVGTVQRAQTARKATLRVALHHLLQLRLVGTASVRRFPPPHDELEEKLGRLRHGRSRKTHGLVRAVGRLAVCDDAEGGHDLLQRVGLQGTRRVDALLEERLVLDGQVDASKYTARHTEARLEITVVEDRRLCLDPKVVALDVEHASSKVTPLVWPTPGNRTAVVAKAACAGGERQSPNQKQQTHVRLHRSANDGSIVLGQERGSAGHPRLGSFHTSSGGVGRGRAQAGVGGERDTMMGVLKVVG